MDDDFNTPEAVAVLFDLASDINISKSTELAGLLKALGSHLGLLERDAEPYLQGKPTIIKTGVGSAVAEGVQALIPTTITGMTKSIEEFIDERTSAKKTKNFAEADRIRKELLDNGIVLEDTPQGTTWRRA